VFYYTSIVIQKHVLTMFCPILLTCQMYTDYTVNAQDILKFGGVRYMYGQ